MAGCSPGILIFKKISKKDKINIEEFLKSVGVKNLKSSI